MRERKRKALKKNEKRYNYYYHGKVWVRIGVRHPKPFKKRKRKYGKWTKIGKRGKYIRGISDRKRRAKRLKGKVSIRFNYTPEATDLQKKEIEVISNKILRELGL